MRTSPTPRSRPHTKRPAQPKAKKKVASRCWCDSTFVMVTTDQVWAGETISCGRDECVKP